MRDTSTGFLGNSAVLIDSSSLLLISETQNDSDAFWTSLIDKAQTSGAQIIIPSGVIRELDRHQNRTDANEDLIASSKRALKSLLDLSEKGAIAVVDDHMNTNCDEREIHADPYFINFVNMFKMRKNIYVITQDVNLMQDIWATLKMASIDGHAKDKNGELIQKVVPKKVSVLKVARKKDGDNWVVLPELLKPFKPDPTVSDIAKELSVDVDKCLAILNERRPNGKFEPNSTVSKHYENFLRSELTDVRSGRGQASKPSEDTQRIKRGDNEPSENSGLPEFKPFGS